MAILQNVNVYYVKCDPTRPSTKVTPDKPRWEVQIRTTDKAQKKEWEALGIKVKVMDPDDGDIYYKATLSKNAFKKVKKDGIDVLEAAKPVDVVDGNLDPMDSRTIGNGSVANIRIFSSDYDFTDKDGKRMTGVRHTLMGLQVTKYIVYEFKEQEGFGKTSTERVEREQDTDVDDDDQDGGFTAAEKAEDPNAQKPPVGQKPEAAF